MSVKYGIKDSSKSTDVSKIGGWKAFYFCFNMIVGYAFLLGLGSVFQDTGNWFLVLNVVCAAIAFIVGLGYAKLSRHYDTNGGVFVFAYKAFGRNSAYFFGWMQYIKSPTVALTTILGMVWAFKGIHLGSEPIGNDGSYAWWLYVLAIGLFILIFWSLYFGFTGGKIALIILSVLKWFFFIFLIGLSLYWLKDAKSFFNNIFANGYSPSTWKTSYKTFLSIAPAIMTFFFAFGGFEDFASMANDFENPKSTLPKAIIFVFVASTVFYLIVFYLILGSLGTTGKFGLDPNSTGTGDINPINNLIYKTFGSGTGAIALAFGLILAFSQVANKSCARLQTSWALSRQLSPLGSSGFLPRLIGRRNKYGQLKNALVFDFIIVSFFICLYLLIAIFVFHNQNSGRLSGALGIYSFIAFVVYFGTLISLIKIASRERTVINLNIYEKIMYWFGIIALALIIILYVYSGVSTYDGFINLIMQLVTIFGFCLVGIVFWVIGYFKNWHKHKYSEDYYLDHIEDPITQASV